MAKDLYVYPAIFDYADDGISISFPDLPGCFSCAHTDEEALYMAKDAAGLMLHCLELDKEEIPEPTPLNKITIGSNQRVVLVEVRMPMIRRAVESASVKKTLTIPAWLNRLAEKHGVNFSQVLQDALREQLGVESSKHT